MSRRYFKGSLDQGLEEPVFTSLQNLAQVRSTNIADSHRHLNANDALYEQPSTEWMKSLTKPVFVRYGGSTGRGSHILC